MAFKTLFLAHAPDAEVEKHRCVIDSILLCPGFTHTDVAKIREAVGENVAISVARGDGPSNRISMEVMKREGWFSGK